MIELIAAGVALAGAGLYAWGTGVKSDAERARRNTLFEIPSRGELVMVVPREQRKIPPIGTPGSPEYKASALYNKCREMGLDIDEESPPLYKIGPRLNTIAVPMGETFDSARFSPNYKTSYWQRLCRDRRIDIDPTTARYIESMPGNHRYCGIEYPRFKDLTEFEPVLFADLLQSPAMEKKKLPVAIGRTAQGKDYVIDLSSTLNPHFIVAGVTGGGKTELLRAFICSALAMPEKHRPDIALIDVAKNGDEFGLFSEHKSLYCPVITAPEQAAEFLRWIVETELPRRGQDKKRHPLIIVCDEVADLFQHPKLGAVISGYFESIVRIGRSLKVHAIMATQVLDAEVFSQQIRGNTPGRICLRTESKQQGNQIIKNNLFDGTKLLGNGDLMTKDLTRVQSAYVDMEYIQKLIADNRRTDEPYKYRTETKADAPVIIAHKDSASDHLKHYEDALKILEKHRLTGISQNILKQELNIKSTDTIVRLVKALETDNCIAGKGTAPKGRRAILI